VVQSDSFGALAFIANELLRRLDRNNIKYDTSKMDLSFIPLNKLFVLIDQHLLARYRVIDLQNSLSSYSAQFRAIQKRLLIKLKDRNPTPLNNLETLLKVAQTQVIYIRKTLRPVCTESFRPGLSLKPGLKLKNCFESYAYQET
jgi:Bardet-Biedl syndrome 9 protein